MTCRRFILLFAIPLQAEFYVAGYIGGASTRRAALDIAQAGRRLTVQDMRWSGRSFQSPVYYGYRAGYYFRENFAVEGEFIHMKIHADLDEPVVIRGAINDVAPFGRYASQFEVSHGLNMALVNAVYRRRIAPRLALTFRAGAGPSIPRPSVTLFGETSGAYEVGPIAVQGAAGAEVRLWRALRAVGEYKYTVTPTSFNVPNGKAGLHVHSQHVVTGISLHFR